MGKQRTADIVKEKPGNVGNARQVRTVLEAFLLFIDTQMIMYSPKMRLSYVPKQNKNVPVITTAQDQSIIDGGILGLLGD